MLAQLVSRCVWTNILFFCFLVKYAFGDASFPRISVNKSVPFLLLVALVYLVFSWLINQTKQLLDDDLHMWKAGPV